MARVKTNFSDIRALLPKLKKAVQTVSRETLQKAIIDKSILLGISPVEGEGKFEVYSPSYKQAIRDGRYKEFTKSISPVNLKLSGELLRSFFVEPTGNGLKVGFRNELAEIHTVRGAGPSKTIRKMLPVGKDEKFKRSIQKEIVDLVQRAIDRILGK